MAMTRDVQDKVAQAGELLIRAAAVLGTLRPEEQAALDEYTDQHLSGGIQQALDAACKVSKAVGESLQRHPPAGFCKDLGQARG